MTMFVLTLLPSMMQAQYKLRFRAYEFGRVYCGCNREGVVANLNAEGTNIEYHWNAVPISGSEGFVTEIEMAEDPRTLTWHYVHIPATPSVCMSSISGCWFVGSNGPLPIYSGPDPGGTTEYINPCQ